MLCSAGCMTSCSPFCHLCDTCIGAVSDVEQVISYHLWDMSTVLQHVISPVDCLVDVHLNGIMHIDGFSISVPNQK